MPLEGKYVQHFIFISNNAKVIRQCDVLNMWVHDAILIGHILLIVLNPGIQSHDYKCYKCDTILLLENNTVRRVQSNVYTGCC